VEDRVHNELDLDQRMAKAGDEISRGKEQGSKNLIGLLTSTDMREEMKLPTS